MPNHLLSFIFIFLSLFQINCVYKEKKLSLMEQFEVEDLAKAIFKQNTPLLMNLLGITSVSGGMKCEVCSFVVDVLKNYLLQKNGIEKFYAILKEICHYTKVDNKVCDGAIDHYDDIIVDSFLRRFLNGDYVCTLLKICNDTTEYDTIEDYAKRILSDKPETKKKRSSSKKK